MKTTQNSVPNYSVITQLESAVSGIKPKFSIDLQSAQNDLATVVARLGTVRKGLVV